MQSLEAAIGRELRWSPRSPFARTYDLVDPRTEGAEPYATLVWRPGLLLGGPAEARSGDGEWRFRRRGVVRGTVLVSGPDEERPLASLRRYWRRAVLRFEDGREFTWRREAFWSLSWRFEDANGTPAIRMRRALWPPAGASTVEIDASVAPPADRALLACLGWYVTLLDRRRQATHSAS